ncbi:MAG: hypothetical protein SVM80_08515 [Halobacteriota archaeon]|nr:hypothetical protein [Halobacteriota archaeon]
MDKSLITGILVGVIVAALIMMALPSLISTPTPTPTPVPIATTTPPTDLEPASQSSCDMCHSDASKEAAHVNGGELCTQCHGGSSANVHELHLSQVCADCHGTGTAPVIPTASEGRSICEKCHAYPDASQPSGGNLVDVHMPRGVGCTVCHEGPIGEIHG